MKKLKMITLNGAFHRQKNERILLMIWDMKFVNAVKKLKESERYASILRNNLDIILFRSHKSKGVKLTLNSSQINCTGNRLIPPRERSSFFAKSNYVRVNIKILPQEWNLKYEDFLSIDEMAKHTKKENRNEERIVLHAGVRFFKRHAIMSIFNRPLAERIAELRNVYGIAYWDKGKIVVSIGKGYKITPSVSHGQVKLTVTNLMSNLNFQKFMNEKNWALVEIEMTSFSQLGVRYIDFFAETKEQKELATAFYQFGYRVKRETHSSKYAVDLFIGDSAIEITNQLPSSDRAKNVLSGSRWGSIAARILKILKCASEIKSPHFVIINKKWEFVDGRSFVRYYKEWLRKYHNIHLLSVNFSNPNWSIRTAKRIIKILKGYNISPIR